MILKSAYSYDDVLLVPKYSSIPSRSEVDLTTNLSENLKLEIPIISANMESVTGLDMARALAKSGGISILPRFQGVDIQLEIISKLKKEKLKVGASIGTKENIDEVVPKFLEQKTDLLVLDVAHGHMEKISERIKEIKSKFPQILLIAGNIATYEGAKFLFDAGCDIVKVGIGPGSICTTRIETGHGVPQFTALSEAVRASKDFKDTKFCKKVIADGGIKNAGDIVKALAIGASCVMAGNILAGTDEAPGEIYESGGIKYKKYFGSTSKEQKEKHQEIIKNNSNYAHHIEGVSGYLPYKGSVVQVLENLKAGIKSGFSYSGARNLEELWRNADFISISPAGQRESNHHDLVFI